MCAALTPSICGAKRVRNVNDEESSDLNSSRLTRDLRHEVDRLKADREVLKKAIWQLGDVLDDQALSYQDLYTRAEKLRAQADRLWQAHVRRQCAVALCDRDACAVFRCQHRICLECLTELHAHTMCQLRCPMCRATHELFKLDKPAESMPASTVNDVPIDEGPELGNRRHLRLSAVLPIDVWVMLEPYAAAAEEVAPTSPVYLPTSPSYCVAEAVTANSTVRTLHNSINE